MFLNQRIRDCVGVNVHPNFAAYSGRLPAIWALVASMGIRWVRCNSNVGDYIAGAHAAGLKVHNVMVRPPNTPLTAAQVTGIINAGADSLGCLNEPTLAQAQDPSSSGTNAQNQTIASALIAAGSPIPLLMSSLPAGSTAVAAALAKPNDVHREDMHCYRGNAAQTAWDAKKNNFTATVESMAPQLGMWVTETGYHDYTGAQNGGHQPTPNDVASMQIVPDLLDWFARGAERVFFYELIDEIGYYPFDSAAYLAGTAPNSHEAHFGLANADLTLKAHGLALQAWLGRYGDLTFGQAFALRDQMQTPRLRMRSRRGGAWS